MVKLIASDLDGTILRKGAQSVEPSTLKRLNSLLIKECTLHLPAEGR